MRRTTVLLVALALLGLSAAQSDAPRRIRLRTRPQIDTTDDRDDSERAPTLVLRRVRPLLPNSDDQLRPALSRTHAPLEEEERVVVIQQAARPYETRGGTKARAKEPNRQPPVQTIRNYSKINDDGSFTFGYEAADGSFKEETRGTDCVVRGKYGYVDPDGNKREFTYVSGNPCDPNAVEEEEEDEDRRADDDGEENIPRVPLRPLQRPLQQRPAPRPVARPAAPPTTLFQQTYRDEQYTTEGPPPATTYRPPATTTYRTPATATYRPPAAVTYQPPATNTYRTPVTNTYRTTTTNTYRPPATVTYRTPTAPAPASNSAFDFDAELRKFQLDNSVVKKVPETPAVASYRPQALVPAVAQPYEVRQGAAQPVVQSSSGASKNGNPIYASQLVFDPSSGQYNTILYQPLPKLSGGADINLEHRLQPFVRPQQQYEPQQFYRPVSQPVYQQQQQQAPRQFYYVSPHQRSSLSSGQIDAFLKGQNIQF